MLIFGRGSHAIASTGESEIDYDDDFICHESACSNFCDVTQRYPGGSEPFNKLNQEAGI